MPTVYITTFTDISAEDFYSGTGWPAVASGWPVSMNGDTGNVATGNVHGPTPELEFRVWSQVVDTGAVPLDAVITSVLVEFNYVLEFESPLDASIRTTDGFTVFAAPSVPGGSGSVSYNTGITDRATIFYPRGFGETNWAHQGWTVVVSGDHGADFTVRVVITSFTVVVNYLGSDPPTNESTPCCRRPPTTPTGNPGPNAGPTPRTPNVPLQPWTRECLGGGLVPQSSDVVDVESWVL